MKTIINLLGLAIFLCCVNKLTASAMDTIRLEVSFDTLCADNAQLIPRIEGASYLWNTGQVNREIQIPATGTYAVSITDTSGTVTIDEREVYLINVPNPVLPEVNEPGPYCLGENITYRVDLTDFDSIQWNNGRGLIYPPTGTDDSQITIPFLPGMTITYIAFYDRCNESLTVLPPLSLAEEDLAPDFAGEITPSLISDVCPDEEVTFSFEGEGFRSLTWEDGSLDTVRRLFPDPEVAYEAQVVTFCQDTFLFPLSITYRADCFPCVTNIPELITPNGDGRNDVFRAFSNCVLADYNLKVFNRWGQSVFSSTVPDQGWDGTLKGAHQQPDTYLYLISFRERNGVAKTMEGQFSLIR